MTNLEFMLEACKESEINSLNNFKDGGPFGAVVVKDDVIIGKGRNKVLSSHDPSAHAEIMAIREACNHLKTHDLNECILYTTCYPCPMCLSCIIWSNIKKVYYGNTMEDASDNGFRDDMIYKTINNILENRDNKDILDLCQLGRDRTIEAFNKFKDNNGQLY